MRWKNNLLFHRIWEKNVCTSKGPLSPKKSLKNVGFSLWHKQCGFPNNCTFSDFSPSWQRSNSLFDKKKLQSAVCLLLPLFYLDVDRKSHFPRTRKTWRILAWRLDRWRVRNPGWNLQICFKWISRHHCRNHLQSSFNECHTWTDEGGD